jgi:hypothetical protein
MWWEHNLTLDKGKEVLQLARTKKKRERSSSNDDRIGRNSYNN